MTQDVTNKARIKLSGDGSTSHSIKIKKKTMQNIDMTQKSTILSKNLFSNDYSSPEWIVKHIELELGLIVKKPIPKESILAAQEKYTAEELKRVGPFEDTSRYMMKQAHMLKNKITSAIQPCNPTILSSNDDEAVNRELENIITNKINWQLYCRGQKQHKPDQKDVHIVSTILSNTGLLRILSKYQKSNESDISDIWDIYYELILDDSQDHYQNIKNAFKSYHQHHLVSSKQYTEIETKWNIIIDWIVAETFKNAGVMIKYLIYEEPHPETGKGYDVIQTSLIDFDTRYVTKLESYKKQQMVYFADFIEYFIQGLQN